MPKTIKLNETTYLALDELREKRETFDEAVQRLLSVFQQIQAVSDTLGPGHYLKRGPAAASPSED